MGSRNGECVWVVGVGRGERGERERRAKRQARVCVQIKASESNHAAYLVAVETTYTRCFQPAPQLMVTQHGTGCRGLLAMGRVAAVARQRAEVACECAHYTSLRGRGAGGEV